MMMSHEYFNPSILLSYNEDKATEASDMFIANPNDDEVTISVYANNLEIEETIPAHDIWDSSQDFDGNFEGHVRVVSTDEDKKIIPLFRSIVDLFMELDVVKFDDQDVVKFDDQVMLPSHKASNELYAPLYLKDWYESDPNKRQWSRVFIANPYDEAVTADVEIYRVVDGTSSALEQKKPFATVSNITIPAKGIYDSYEDEKWNSVAMKFMVGGQEVEKGQGWMKIITRDDNKKLIARKQVRFNHVHQNGESNQLKLFDDDYFIPKEYLSTKYYVPMYLNNWPAEGNLKQYGNTVVVNPSIEEVKDFNISFNFYNVFTGERIFGFDKKVLGTEWFNGYTDLQWKNVEKTPVEGVEDGSFTLVDITAENPVFGLHRMRVEKPSNPTDNSDDFIVEFDDDQGMFVSAQSIGGCTSSDDCGGAACTNFVCKSPNP